MSRCGALCLLNGGGFYQNLEILVDLPLLGVDRLGNATQKHRRSGNVLASPSKLWGIVPLVVDVMLDLVGVTLGTTHWVPCTGRGVLYRARRRGWRLVVAEPPEITRLRRCSSSTRL